MRSPADMNTVPFITLLRREWLEHRTALIFPPAAILALVILALIFGTLFSKKISVDLDLEDEASEAPSLQRFRPQARTQFFLADNQYAADEEFRAMPAVATDWNPRGGLHPSAQPAASVPPLGIEIDDEDLDDVSSLQRALAVPYFFVLILVMSFLSVSVTWDERKDRSILFWKSMPVGDTRSILAKFLFLGWITPAATFVAVVITQIIVLLALDFYSDKNLIAWLLTSSEAWVTLFKLLGFTLYIGIWLAPFLAWGMLVGAAAPRSPTLIAMLLPLLLTVTEKVVFDTNVLFDFVVNQLSLEMFAQTFDGDVAAVLPYIGQKLMGVGLAVLFLIAAIWSRRRFSEV